MKRKTWRSAVALVLAVQMAVASGVTAMAQTNMVALNPSSQASVSVVNDGEEETITRYLSDMEPAKATVGWGSLMYDQGLENLPLKLRTEDGGTKVYEKGICAHAASELVYDIEGRGVQRFQSYIGVNYSKSRGTCGFTVKADDEVLFTVDRIAESDPQQYVDVEIPADAKQLILITTTGGDSNDSDHSVWADAKLILDATVQQNLYKVTASTDKTILDAGETVNISLSGTLVDDSVADLSNAEISYTSSDNEVATVDGSGAITAVANGLATITCDVTLDGITKSASIDLIVGDEVEGKVWSVTSPEGNVGGIFMLGSEGNLSYTVQRDEKSVLDFGAMGMKTEIGDFSEGLEFVSVSDATTVDETYSVNSHKKAEYRNHYTERTITFMKDGVQFDVVVRAYDDGLAFRYVIHGPEGESYAVEDEATTFKLPAGSNVWSMAYGSGAYSYESHFYKYTAESVSGNQTIPMLYETPDGTFGMISEALLTGYMGSMVVAQDGQLKVSATPLQSTDPTVEGTFAFPWRFTVVGTLGDINENTMTENLSPAPAEGDYSWAEPGVCSWTWLVGGAGMQSNPDQIKKYIDFASEMGWKYFIMDEGWQPRSNQGDGTRYFGEYGWIEDVIKYANEKGVGLIAWVHVDDLNTAEKRAQRLDRWAELGIKGIKVDFFDRETDERVQLMEDVYADCERLHLVTNVHGANKPTGEVRTHPGILTREGIYGQEMGDLRAEQYTILPFTRNAVGPADVTETVYPRGGSTTSGFQVALSVLITSGMHCLASSVEDYQSSPALSFYKDFPSVWDDTHFIDGYPGEFTELARRSGDKWYACAITDEARDAEFKLDFLDDGEYYAMVYADDGTSNRGLKLEIEKVTKDDTLTVPMKDGGGCAVIFTKEKPSAAETIEFAEHELTLERNTSTTLDVTITPEEPLITSLIWESSDPTVATVDGSGNITALRPGTAVITATSPVDDSVSDSCTVTVEMEKYTLDRNTWTIERESSENISFPSETSMIQNSQSGDVDGNADSSAWPKNMVLFPMKDEDFTATVKVSGGLDTAFQTVALTAFANSNNAASVMRRYHSNFGGNVFEFMRYQNGYSEPYVADTNPSEDAYLKLERNGNIFKGYYSYDGQEWVQIAEQDCTQLLSQDNVMLGVYTGNGAGNNNSIQITIEDFTYNDELIPFAVSTETTITDVEPVALGEVYAGTAFEDLQLPSTVKVTLLNGTEAELPVTWAAGDYDGDTLDTYTLEGTITLENGALNVMDLKATATVTVVEAPVEDNTITATYNNKDVTLSVDGEPQKIADLLGKLEMKDVTTGSNVELTFAPRVEGKNFRSVSIDGAEPELISGDSYTYTVPMEGDGVVLDFVFEVTDKRILEETYNYAKTYVDDGTVDSLVTAAKEAFMEAYEAAAAVLDDDTATQAQIDAAWNDLLNVIHYLDFQAGDASALEELYNILSGLVEDDFTSDSWAAFEEAMTQAAEVIADDEPLEADVTKAYEDLLKAAEGLVRASDLSSLNDLIEKAEEVAAEIAEGKYLPDGQEAFQAALDAAKALTKDDAQATINEAAQTLTEAMAALRKKADKSELEAILNELEALDASDYTATSYAAVAASIANLKTLLADETLDAEEGQAVVDNAVAQARAAKANLVEVSNGGSNSGSSSNGSTSANVGNAYGASGVVAAGQNVSAVSAYVRSDTTVNFTLKHGQAYCFKMTVVNGNAMTPSFTVGNGDVLKTQFVAKIGNDYYYRVYAIGTPGQSTGVYTTLPGQNAVKHCTVTIG